jgi:hypothetical protein
MHMASPRPTETLPTPAETNTSHTGRLCEKTLQEHPHSCKASGATPAGALTRPHGTAQHIRGKNVPSTSINLCGILMDTTTDARGLLSGTAIGVPKNRGETHFLSKKQNTNELTNVKHAQDNHGSVEGAHGPGGLSGPSEQSAPATLGQNSSSLEGHNTALSRLHLARGLDAPSGKAPPRSRARHPLEQVSASLEALTGSLPPYLLPRSEHLMF